MHQVPDPNGSEEEAECTTARPSRMRRSRGGIRVSGPQVRQGLRVVLCVLAATLAAFGDDEALAGIARALIAVGDMIVDAGEHKRS